MSVAARRLSLRGGGHSFPQWMPVADALKYLATGFTKHASNPILPKGAGGTWDDFGVRELAPVVDEHGVTVREADGIWAYYGGRGDSAGVMDIGLAKSTDNGITWTKYGSNPLITQAGSGWYQTGIAQPSTVKLLNGTRVMLAQGLNSTTYTIGCLTSTDGMTWTDAGQKLANADFSHGANSITLLGVPNLIKRESGSWLCFLEGLTNEASPAWHIFGATATDPTGTWTVMNSGAPIFTHTGAGWEAQGVANPHVIEATPNVFLMAYNALDTGAGNFQIGFAYTTDFSSWTRFSGNPVLLPNSAAWDTPMVEVSSLRKDVSGRISLYYQGGDPVTGAQQIGLATAP